MKSIVTEGTVEKAPCEKCRRFVTATYGYGPVEMDGLVVDDVMRATCDECGSVVATAPQSAHRFKTAFEERRQKRTTVRMPQEVLDFVSLQLSQVGADLTHVELYFRALLLACRGQEKSIGAELSLLRDPVLDRPNRVTVNLNLGSHLLNTLELLQQASGLKATAEILRRLLVMADGSLESKVRPEIDRLACAYA